MISSEFWSARASHEGKLGHMDREHAKREAKQLRRVYGWKTSVYRCDYCGLFHVGTIPSWRSLAAARTESRERVAA